MSDNTKTILSNKGYAIIKTKFNFKDLNRTKKELTVSPYINENFGGKATAFPIYLESPKKIYLPKHYGFVTMWIIILYLPWFLELVGKTSL